MNLYNVELQISNWPDEHGKTLCRCLFYDVGGDWDSFQQMSYRLVPVHGLKSGVGFGIRFKTTVFPLRLDWAML